MEANSAGKTVPSRRLNLDFWKYWTGQTISNLGSSVTLFAIPLLVYKLTGSPVNLGISVAAEFLPYPLLGLLLGALTDRVNRKHLMILTDIGRALVIAWIPLLYLTHNLSVWWIYAVGFLHSTLTICFEAGQFAAIPNLVNQDDLVTANGRITASLYGAQVAGPMLAGLLVFLMPLPELLLVDASSFLVSALSLVMIRTSFNSGKAEKKPTTNIGQDVIEGLRYVLRHPVLRNISMMMAMMNFIGNAAFAQLVLFAKEQLSASDTQISLIFSAGSVGVVLLSLAAGPLRKRWSFSTVALGALMLGSLLQLALAFTRWYWLGLILFACIQGLGILFNINTASLRQAIVPNHMLGRVMSIASVLAWSAIPLGALAGGFLTEWTHNIVMVYAIVAVLGILIPICFSFTALGHAEKYLPKKEEEEAAIAG